MDSDVSRLKYVRHGCNGGFTVLWFNNHNEVITDLQWEALRALKYL